MTQHSRPFYLAVIFWVGFSALVYQIYGVRVLFMFFVENTHALAIAIASFLGGLACSSLIFPRIAGPSRRNLPILCLMMLASGLYGYSFLAHYEWIPRVLDLLHENIASAAIFESAKYTIMWLYLFLPAFCLGGAFPLINGLYLGEREEWSRDSGTVYFWDTLGAIAGALCAGFILLPLAGLRATVMVAVGVNLIIAAVLMPRRLYGYSLIGGVWLLAAAETWHHLYVPDRQFTVSTTGHIMPVLDLHDRFGRVLFQKESPYGRITVGSMPHSKMLFVNYRTMCETNRPAGQSEQELARLAMNALPAHSDVLNIGLGCGITASELAFHAHTHKLDIVEINPVIAEAAQLFSTENRNVLGANNVALHIADGAQWLRNAQDKTYDAIVIDVEEVSVIYSSPLYTQEYFKIIRQRLKPGGIFALWSFTVGPDFTGVLRNTLGSVFPYVTTRYYGNHAIHFASMQPIEIKPGKPPFASSMAGGEINTLENRALEKYYNSNRTFGLPDYYSETFIRE